MRKKSLGQLTNQASRLFRRVADQRLEPLGMSSGQLPLLTALMDRQPLSQKELVEHSGIEQPTVAATLARMERDGIILRQADSGDRRSSLFYLTAEALGKMNAVKKIIESMNMDAARGLSERQIVEVRKSLTAMIDALSSTLTDEP